MCRANYRLCDLLTVFFSRPRGSFPVKGANSRVRARIGRETAAIIGPVKLIEIRAQYFLFITSGDVSLLGGLTRAKCRLTVNDFFHERI